MHRCSAAKRDAGNLCLNCLKKEKIQMGILGNRSFVTVVFSEKILRGAYFDRKGNRLGVVRYCEVEVSGNRDAAWKKLVRELDFSSTVPLFVGGNAPGVTFFRTNSVAMDTQSRRSALEMELGRHMLSQAPDHKIQFVPLSERSNGEVPVNVCVVPESLFSLLASAFSSCSRRADNFIYPLLALKEDDPAFYQSEIEESFEFSEGQWRMHQSANAPAEIEKWSDIFEELFYIPEDMEIEKYLGVLLMARLVSSDDFGSLRDGIRVLPDQLRPVRFRNHLICGGILLLLLIANLIWGTWMKWSRSGAGYRDINGEVVRMDQNTKKIKNQLKRESRAHKERLRIVASKAGAHDILTDLADFSRLLPASAMVTSYRRGEEDIDIVISSEDENINFPQLLKPIADRWRVGQVQQRQRGNSTSVTVNLKLVPAEKEKKKTVKAGKRERK